MLAFTFFTVRHQNHQIFWKTHLRESTPRNSHLRNHEKSELLFEMYRNFQAGGNVWPIKVRCFFLLSRFQKNQSSDIKKEVIFETLYISFEILFESKIFRNSFFLETQFFFKTHFFSELNFPRNSIQNSILETSTELFGN